MTGRPNDCPACGATDCTPGTCPGEVEFERQAQELRQAEARYQRASTRAEAEREARNAAVRRAIEAGWTHAQIAQATGLTRSRVGQIALQ